MLRKAFVFGAFIWLLKDAGLAMRTAIIAVVLTILGIEILHLWQPGRSSSLTDPSLALLMGLLMRLASDEPKARRRQFARR